MLKRLFEATALGTLGYVVWKWYRGKRVNPRGLRLLLAILTTFVLLLDSRLIVIFSGTWLAFLLTGDLSRRVLGREIRLFDDRRQNREKFSTLDEEEKQRGSLSFAQASNFDGAAVPVDGKVARWDSILRTLRLKS